MHGLSRKSALLLIVVAVAAVIAAGAWALPVGEWFAEPAEVGTPVPAAPALTAEETAFYAFLSPRLRELQGETTLLLDLGKARSRNLLELQERSDRVDEISAEIDGFLGERATPELFVPAMEEYAAGVAAARSAMRETRAGIGRLDWDRVGKAVEIFGIAVERLGAAVDLIEGTGGSGATPSP